MLQLPNDARCSDLSVFPSNWADKKTADLTISWSIRFRYYPAEGKPYSKHISNMNRLKTWKARYEATKQIIDITLKDLQQGWNPITNEGLQDIQEDEDEVAHHYLTRESPTMAALWFAHQEIKPTITQLHWKNIRGVLRSVQAGCKMNRLVISKTTRKDVLKMLNQVGEYIKKQPAKQLKKGEVDNDSIPRRDWTNNNYNRYRKLLGSCFSICVDHELMDVNPVDKRLKERQVITEEEKLTLTPAERNRVKEHLRPNYPAFYRYVQIFFHSGGRSTELLGIQGKDVDLNNQTFKVLVKKGGQWVKVKKAIKNIALDYWLDQMGNCGANDYVFSDGLMPGPKKITPAMITKRWRVHVKKKLNIEADFYSLKHLNLDEVAEVLDIESSKKMASHTSEATTELYAQKEKDRTLERLKKVVNEF